MACPSFNEFGFSRANMRLISKHPNDFNTVIYGSYFENLPEISQENSHVLEKHTVINLSLTLTIAWLGEKSYLSLDLHF